MKRKREEKDVLQGMVAAGNSFKDSPPPNIPNPDILEAEKERLGLRGMTIYFSLPNTRKERKNKGEKSDEKDRVILLD